MFDPFDPKYARIELSNKPGLFFVVSKRHEERVRQYKWYLLQRKIVATIGGSAKTIGRFILGITDPNIEVDHISGNIFNNSDENLRTGTHQENCRNMSKPKSVINSEKGASWKESCKKWQARICVSGKRISLGYYKTEKEAAEAYNKAALLYFGQFAKLNEPNP